MKIANTDREIFRKDVTFENIKSHKKPGLHLLFRRCIFQKTASGGVKLTPLSPPLLPHPQPFLRLRKRGHLSQDTLSYFLVKGPKFARFYLLPKIPTTGI